MARGRPRKPTELKLLEGSRVRPHDRNAEAPKWELPDGVPAPPEWLWPLAREEWIRLAPEMHKKGMLTSASMAAFQSYCQSYAEWRGALEVVKNANEMVSEGRAGIETVAAMVRVMREANKEMRGWMSEFGMTPSTRTKAHADKPAEPEDPAQKWVKGSA